MGSKVLVRVLQASAALAIAVPGVAMAGPNDVGVASVVVNDVRVRNAGAAQPHAAKVKERLALADQVATGQRSQMQLLLLDKSTFTVGANARLTIDRFVYDPRGSAVSASVAKGAFRFLSGGGRKNGPSTIKTPVATIGIRGTMIDGVIGGEAIIIARGEGKVGPGMALDPEVATLIVLRGPGPKTMGAVQPGAISVSAGGATVDLDAPLLAVFVPSPGAQPIGPFKLSLPGLARLEGLILPPARPNLQGGGSTYAPPPPPPYRPPYYMPGPDGGPGGGPGDYVPTLPSIPQTSPTPQGGGSPAPVAPAAPQGQSPDPAGNPAPAAPPPPPPPPPPQVPGKP